MSRIIKFYLTISFTIWGRYKRHWLKTTLTVSFQFHHTQMEGAHATQFLDGMQHEIDALERIFS